MKLLKQFIQQETVLTAAAVLAVVSAFFVPPDAQYLGYIDLRTLAILFSLMTVMAGLRRQGFFDGLGRALLSRTHSTFQLTLVLVGLCFFGSMFITNDVSLLTFVPFTFVVLSRLGADVRRALLIPVVCMQTIAANLGSMLTPIGNPQNSLFESVFSKASIAVLSKYSTPQKVKNAHLGKLTDILMESSNGHFGEWKAHQLKEAAWFRSKGRTCIHRYRSLTAVY